jgi:hypothetical protein
MDLKSKFTESKIDLDYLEDEIEVQKRRVAVYSVDALRAATAIDKIYVNHTSFAEAIKAMDRIFHLAPEMDIPQGMLLSGQTGVGKTTVFKYFAKSLPPSSLFAPGMGAIAIRCQKKTSTGYLIGSMLNRFQYPFSTGTGRQLYARRRIVFDAIKEKKTRLLFLDEASGFLTPKKNQSSISNETDASDFLRELMDECRIGIVIATKLGADALDGLDDALASRISVRQTLNAFKSNAEWLGMMNAFVAQCKTFDISLISSNSVGNKLNLASQGNLRGLKRLLSEAILIAVDSGKPQLDEEIFRRAFSIVYGQSVGRPNVFQ